MEKKNRQNKPKSREDKLTAELSRWLDENEDHLPSDFNAMRLDYDLITGILTRERIRLINHLRENGPVDSLQELADALGRDKAAVSRDVSYLSGTFIEEEKQGRRRRIWAPRKPLIIY